MSHNPTFAVLGVDPGDRTHAFAWCQARMPCRSPLDVDPINCFMIEREEAMKVIATGNPIDSHPWMFGAERIASAYGGAGRDLFDTQWEASRMCEAARSARGCFRVRDDIFRATAAAYVGKWEAMGATGDAEVRRAIIDIYGGRRRAIGGGRCKTCKKPEGWIGHGHRPCPNCNAEGGGHGWTGHEDPRGPLWPWEHQQDGSRQPASSHLYAALAVALVAAAGEAIPERLADI